MHTPRLSTVETRAKQLHALPDLRAALLEELLWGVGPRDLRTACAALETLAGIPLHHRDTTAADAPAAPELWLWTWCRGRANTRRAERAEALHTYTTAKVA